MALTGVIRPGHIQLRMLDLEAGVHHSRDVLGLEETGRDDQGRVYLKTWDERDHSSVILRRPTRPAWTSSASRCSTKPALDQLERAVQDYGIETTRLPAGEMLETGERVRFVIPTGHQFELYATKTLVGNPLGTNNPKSWCPDSDRGIAPVRFDHALLYGPDVLGVLDLFTNVLGFHLTEYVTLPDSDEKGALWLSCSNKAHDIALVVHPEPDRFHHVSFLLDSWRRAAAAQIMAVNDVPVDIGPTQHGITRGGTIYAWDPCGQPVRDLPGRHRALPGLGADGLDLGRTRRRRRLDMSKRVLHDTFLSIVT
ncbi:MAG: VOC family protein [Acidimicrobiales bacterium]